MRTKRGGTRSRYRACTIIDRFISFFFSRNCAEHVTGLGMQFPSQLFTDTRDYPVQQCVCRFSLRHTMLLDRISHFQDDSL